MCKDYNKLLKSDLGKLSSFLQKDAKKQAILPKLLSEALGAGNIMRCSMTGRLMSHSFDGIWDDGEWISWEWINGQLAYQELQAEYPKASLEVVRVFEGLVTVAQEYYDATGRYLQIWGNLEKCMRRSSLG